MKTYEAQFAIAQRVAIRDLDDQKAVVLSLHISKEGVTYEVAWFHGGERKTAYLFAHELKERE
jgi:hypothetical protein